MFYFDPLYMVLILIGIPLIYVPQWWIKRTYETYSHVGTFAAQKGVDVALDILRQQGITGVEVEVTPGVLSDHYDPISRKVRLSQDNYYGTSVAAVAVSAHEVGHAIQHAGGFSPVVLRSAMAPVVNIGSQFGPLLIIMSLILMGMRFLAPSLGLTLAWVGVILFGLAVLFHVVTLPVEIDASRRAVGILQTSQYLTAQEVPLAKKVLIAAAFTYVATALYALMQLLYFIFEILGASRRNN